MGSGSAPVHSEDADSEIKIFIVKYASIATTNKMSLRLEAILPLTSTKKQLGALCIPPACTKTCERKRVNIYNRKHAYLPIFSLGACRKSRVLAKSGNSYMQVAQPLMPRCPLSLLSEAPNRKSTCQTASL